MKKQNIRRIAYPALLISCLIIIFVVSGASGPYWTKSYHLSAGLGVMHEIQVVNGAELILHSPPGSNFDLYAMNNPGPFGSCPSNTYIMSHAERSTAGMGSDTMILEPGLWCLVVYAQSGGGTYLLEASTLEMGSSGGWPADPGGALDDPWSDWWEPSDSGSESDWRGFNGTWGFDGPGFDEGMYNPFASGSEGGPGPVCIPYRSVRNPGVIDAGVSDGDGVYARDGTYFPNADTFAFNVEGYRSDIELITIGPCGRDVPDRMLTGSEITELRRIPTFNGTCRASYVLLVSQDCNPNDPHCPVQAQVNSSGHAYYRIENPTPGSTYYVSIATIGIYLRDIPYELLVRSYQC